MFTHADGSPWRASNQHRPMREACLHAEIIPPVAQEHSAGGLDH